MTQSIYEEQVSRRASEWLGRLAEIDVSASRIKAELLALRHENTYLRKRVDPAFPVREAISFVEPLPEESELLMFIAMHLDHKGSIICGMCSGDYVMASTAAQHGLLTQHHPFAASYRSMDFLGPTRRPERARLGEEITPAIEFTLTPAGISGLGRLMLTMAGKYARQMSCVLDAATGGAEHVL